MTGRNGVMMAGEIAEEKRRSEKKKWLKMADGTG